MKIGCVHASTDFMLLTIAGFLIFYWARSFAHNKVMIKYRNQGYDVGILQSSQVLERFLFIFMQLMHI